METTWRTAVEATLDCLTGCAIGEVLGMVLATWWGWGTGASLVLAIALAFFFGYLLTFVGVRRAGLGVPSAVRTALAIAFVLTVPVNRALIARGKGHAVVHHHLYGHH